MTKEETQIYNTNIILSLFAKSKYYSKRIHTERGLHLVSLRIASAANLEATEVKQIIKDTFIKHG